MYYQENFWDKILETFHPELCAGDKNIRQNERARCELVQCFKINTGFFSKQKTEEF